MSGEIMRVSSAVEILTKRRIGTDVFRRCLESMDANHYLDVVQRRMRKKFCGYPLCDKILRKLNDIECYRTTDMNKNSYCTVSCYEASIYLEDMIEFKVFIKENLFWFRKNSPNISFEEDVKEDDCESFDIDGLCKKFEKLQIDMEDTHVGSSELDSTLPYYENVQNSLFGTDCEKSYKYGFTYKPCTDEDVDKDNSKYKIKKIKGINKFAKSDASGIMTKTNTTNRKVIVPIRRANKGISESYSKMENVKQVSIDKAIPKPFTRTGKNENHVQPIQHCDDGNVIEDIIKLYSRKTGSDKNTPVQENLVKVIVPKSKTKKKVINIIRTKLF